MYRELLFQKVAKRAIESAEFMVKNSPTSSKQNEARVFCENRKLQQENARLKKDLAIAEDQLQIEAEERQFETARHNQKLGRVFAQANRLSSSSEYFATGFVSIKERL